MMLTNENETILDKNNTLEIKFKRVRPNLDADIPLPRYMTPHSAGMDICAAVQMPYTLRKGEIGLIPTGFAIQIPPGFEAQIRPRSGLAVKHGIGIINAPGTVDADYRGEIKIALVNLGQNDFVIQRGDRIAQIIVQKVYHVQVTLSEILEPTERDTGGFGHTGV